MKMITPTETTLAMINNDMIELYEEMFGEFGLMPNDKIFIQRLMKIVQIHLGVKYNNIILEE